MEKLKIPVWNRNSLISKSPGMQKFNFQSIIIIVIYLIVTFHPVLTIAQDARVITFTHTIRWLNESNFPNYFLLPEVRDTITANIQRILIQQYKVANVSFPKKVEYHIITGFGKPKNSSSVSKYSAGYDVEIFSFLTRATTGYAVFWSVDIIIRKDGNVILEKEVKHEIENASSSAYMTAVRWMSPRVFQQILDRLIREALGIGGDYTAKIIVGGIEEKETEMRSWFTGSTRYLLKKNGVWLNAGNFAAQMTTEKDTVIQFEYKNKLDLRLGKISLKPILADLFTEMTGIGTTYTIIEKERKRGVLEFSGGKKLLIEMDWIEEVTVSTVSGETESRISVPLIGQLYNDTILAGNFIYEKISKTLVSSETKEKFSLASGTYQENSFGTAVIHRIKGNLNNKPFIAEYNQLFGLVEIKSDNQTLAAMIVQNCNPENLQSFDKNKLSKNKRTISESGSNFGTPSLENRKKLEWYPFYVKGNATTDELQTSLGIMVCLFFGIGNM
jgi:hypothetical protein